MYGAKNKIYILRADPRIKDTLYRLLPSTKHAARAIYHRINRGRRRHFTSNVDTTSAEMLCLEVHSKHSACVAKCGGLGHMGLTQKLLCYGL